MEEGEEMEEEGSRWRRRGGDGGGGEEMEEDGRRWRRRGGDGGGGEEMEEEGRRTRGGEDEGWRRGEEGEMGATLTYIKLQVKGYWFFI